MEFLDVKNPMLKQLKEHNVIANYGFNNIDRSKGTFFIKMTPKQYNNLMSLKIATDDLETWYQTSQNFDDVATVLANRRLTGPEI